MAHGRKKFCEVNLPGEPRRIKRSRKRTRADILSWALHDHEKQVGYRGWLWGRNPNIGCLDCRAIYENSDGGHLWVECRNCHDIDEMRYYSQKYRVGNSVPKGFRKMLDDFDKAERKRIERRLVQAYNAGMEQEDDARRLEFNKYYRDAAWLYW